MYNNMIVLSVVNQFNTTRFYLYDKPLICHILEIVLCNTRDETGCFIEAINFQVV